MATENELIVEVLDDTLTALSTAGAKPDYSIDGESFSHASNRAQLIDQAERALKLKQKLSAPFIINRRGRAF